MAWLSKGNDSGSKSVITAQNLTNRFRDVVAVDGIDFAIDQGECFGFLGPNGAGKTTIMKMIGCISPVTEGELWVDGKSVVRDQRAIKAQLGVVSQADSLDPDLSVIQNLVAYGRFFSEIIQLPNVFLSPHIAGWVASSYPRIFTLMVDELDRFFHGHETLFDLTPGSLANRRGSQP